MSNCTQCGRELSRQSTICQGCGRQNVPAPAPAPVTELDVESDAAGDAGDAWPKPETPRRRGR